MIAIEKYREKAAEQVKCRTTDRIMEQDQKWSSKIYWNIALQNSKTQK